MVAVTVAASEGVFDNVFCVGSAVNVLLPSTKHSIEASEAHGVGLGGGIETEVVLEEMTVEECPTYVVVMMLAEATNEELVVEEVVRRPKSEIIVERSPVSVERSVVPEEGKAVGDESIPRVIVLVPSTTHSKLLLLAQGVVLEVETSAYFNDDIGARLTTPEGVSTHSQLLLSAQGVEFDVQLCDKFTFPGGGIGVVDVGSSPVVCAIGPSVVVLDAITKHSRVVLSAQGAKLSAQPCGRFPAPGGGVGSGAAVALPSPSI